MHAYTYVEKLTIHQIQRIKYHVNAVFGASSLASDGKGLPMRQASVTSLASSLASGHSAGVSSSVGDLLRGASIRSMGDLIDAVNDTVIPAPSSPHAGLNIGEGSSVAQVFLVEGNFRNFPKIVYYKFQTHFF